MLKATDATRWCRYAAVAFPLCGLGGTVVCISGHSAAARPASVKRVWVGAPAPPVRQQSAPGELSHAQRAPLSAFIVGRVHGNVRSSDGSPLANASVCGVGASSSRGNLNACVATDEGGGFRLPKSVRDVKMVLASAPGHRSVAISAPQNASDGGEPLPITVVLQR